MLKNSAYRCIRDFSPRYLCAFIILRLPSERKPLATLLMFTLLSSSKSLLELDMPALHPLQDSTKICSCCFPLACAIHGRCIKAASHQPLLILYLSSDIPRKGHMSAHILLPQNPFHNTTCWLDSSSISPATAGPYPNIFQRPERSFHALKLSMLSLSVSSRRICLDTLISCTRWHVLCSTRCIKVCTLPIFLILTTRTFLVN
jgi:hypothetical protein